MEGQAFAGRAALVTGGGSGIGAALADGLARRGCRVAVTDLDGASAEAVASKIRRSGGVAAGFPLDVTQAAAWQTVAAAATEKFGPMSILCSNAGVTGDFAPVTEMSPDYLRWLLEVNVMGALLAVRQMVPHMIASGAGGILFTASMAGLASAPCVGGYSASKHALIALAESLRQEVAEHGVTVSVLCPAAVATDLARNSRAAAPTRLRKAGLRNLSSQMRASLTAGSGGSISAQQAAEAGLEALAEGRFFALTHAQAGERALARSRSIEHALQALSPGVERPS